MCGGPLRSFTPTGPGSRASWSEVGPRLRWILPDRRMEPGSGGIHAHWTHGGMRWPASAYGRLSACLGRRSLFDRACESGPTAAKKAQQRRAGKLARRCARSAPCQSPEEGGTMARRVEIPRERPGQPSAVESLVSARSAERSGIRQRTQGEQPGADANGAYPTPARDRGGSSLILPTARGSVDHGY